jgi:hypothetical protein
MKKSISHIVRKQIKQELREQQVVPIVSKPTTTAPAQETTQSQGIDSSNKYLASFISAVLGNRILTGYRVVRTEACTGMQVYLLNGSAYFNVAEYIELTAGMFFEVPVYTDDQWVYIYLKKDGTILANKYSPIIGDNKEYIPLSMIWVEAGSTEVNPKFIVDLRPNKVASLAELYGIRSQQAEVYNIFPNTFVGTDKVELAPVSGELKIHVIPNDSALVYMQGHIVILPDSELDLVKPLSGSKDYWIIAHGYIDNLDLIYKLQYMQVEVGTTIERFQIVIGRINGVTSATTEITSGMIDDRMQRNCQRALEVPTVFIFNKEGILTEDVELDIVKIVPEKMRIKNIKAFLKYSYCGSGLSESIVIDILKNDVSIFQFESGVEHRLNIPITIPDGSIVDSGDIDLDKIYLEANDILKAKIISIPFYTGYLPEDLVVAVECVVDTQRPNI